MYSHQSRGTRGPSGTLVESFMDNAKLVFQISIVVTVCLYAYLLYGLFTGALVNVANMSAADQARILDNLGRFSLALNVSLAVLIITSILLYYNEAILGYIFLILAAVLAYGLQLSIDFFFASDAARYTAGQASATTLNEIWKTGIMFGVPGIALILRNMYIAIRNGRYNQDLTIPTYGKDAVREEVPRSLIPVFSKCWQMPFCREGVRKECPIFHAKTKCWKERVGCMCEENIIRLSMANAPEEKAKAAMGVGSGFVPIGDLITQSLAADKEKIPTRAGPKGVRIPTNPHLSEGQKRERCRNCIIYNEHQRYKYQLLAPIITLMVPLLVFLQFDNLRALLTSTMAGLDSLVAHLSFSTHPGGASSLTTEVTNSISVETIIIVCITLILMTWALRFVEFCVYKLKI